MLYNMFHGKIHRATVTEANLEYMGSITIDSELLELSGILPGERVQVVDNNNGNRLETYVIAGEPGSGVICLNGAAARQVVVGDTVINTRTPSVTATLFIWSPKRMISISFASATAAATRAQIAMCS